MEQAGMNQSSIRRMCAVGTVAVLGLILSACLLAPGTFNSTLDIRKDGRFSFTYSGEIYFLSPSEMTKSGKADAKFEPQPCTASNGEERACNSAELDRQMRDWEKSQKDASSGKGDESAQMAAMMGGMDMSDPETAQEFTRTLERQYGWRRVTYKGNGLFDVDFAVSGRLDHDFTFPTMEGFPMANPFVQIFLRKDGALRVEAPGYSSGASGGPMKGLAQLAAQDQSKDAAKKAPQLPKLDGSFTVSTDGKILANNTDEGPLADSSGSKLSWKINERSEKAPTALIRLLP